jgi:hypothetical protein
LPPRISEGRRGVEGGGGGVPLVIHTPWVVGLELDPLAKIVRCVLWRGDSEAGAAVEWFHHGQGTLTAPISYGGSCDRAGCGRLL